MKFKNYSVLLLLTIITLFTACKEDQTVPKSSAKAITKLVFAQFTPAVQATIDESTKKITAVVPPTADVSKLIPSISVSIKAKVLPDSGKVQDFTNAVTYTVTAEDGTSVNYQVTVSRTKFSVKDITEFSFADFSPAIVAKIDAATKTITATLPSTADLTKLKPTIKISDRATINPATGTVIDFSKAVNFTVTAEDASTQVYAVTITKEAPPVVVTGLFPTSITYIDNPLQPSVLKTVNYTWTNGVLTKLVEKRGTSTVERVFTRDKDGLITKIDVNFDGSKSVENYTYSADKKTITFTNSAREDITWTYNDRGFLVKKNVKSTTTFKEYAINLTWEDKKDVVNKVDDGDLLSTMSAWSGTNPLWEVAKQTQFLFVDNYNYNTTLLFLGNLLPNAWGYKYSFSSTTRTADVTKTVDSQKRITGILVEQGLATAQDMKIVY
jgi:YD repeat-containing protein